MGIHEDELSNGEHMRQKTTTQDRNIVTGALSGVNSGTASIEATKETSGLGMASVAMTGEATYL